MAATIAGNVIRLDLGTESTSDIFRKVRVSAIKIVAGATSGATVIQANGSQLYSATPTANTVVDIGPQAEAVWYDSITAPTLGTNVVCYVHIT